LDNESILPGGEPWCSVAEALRMRRRKNIYHRLISSCIVLSGLLQLALAGLAGAETVRIGVLANRGPERCLAEWSATAEYLAQAVQIGRAHV
jgi:hypothetical protein